MENYQEYEAPNQGYKGPVPEDSTPEDDIKPLSDKELRELLAELEADDDAINEIEEQYSKRTEIDEEIDALAEERDKSTKTSAQVLRRQRISQNAFTQNKIILSDPVPKDMLKRLISLLTAHQRETMARHEAFINKRLTQLLSPLIPHTLKKMRHYYPHVFKISPGFMYLASKEYGGGKTFWATPNIPAYFTQGAEMEILRKEKPEFLFTVDKTVAWHAKVKKELTERELHIATKLVNMGESSWYKLLKLNPFWFETLYNDVTQTKLCE